jgi:putative serine protease PepD
MRSRGARLRRAAAAAAAIALATAGLTACGGSGRSAATTVTVTTSAAAAATAPATTGTTTGEATRAALALQQAYVHVVTVVSPSVVQIETSAGLGSGVVFDAKGDIVTNAHVVGSSSSFTVTTYDGRQLRGTLVGKFVPDDLAVVKVPASASLKPVAFADSAKLDVGDIAIAIGNPLGLSSSVTTGIVSARGRTVTEPSGATLPPVIQTSAPINPGNSGGALVDIEGKLIGIPTLAATDPQIGGSAPGIGFAIPSNVVEDIASQLVRHGKVVNSHRAYLGVRVGDTNGNGVYVGQVLSGTPAAKAGLHAGDVIVSVAGQDTPTTDALSGVLAQLKPGKTVKVVVRRQNGSRATLSVTLGQLPGSSSP